MFSNIDHYKKGENAVSLNSVVETAVLKHTCRKNLSLSTVKTSITLTHLLRRTHGQNPYVFFFVRTKSLCVKLLLIRYEINHLDWWTGSVMMIRKLD